MNINHVKQTLTAIVVILGGCASRDTAETTLSTQAVTIVDCQTSAAECLGAMPSRDQIQQCRDDLAACLNGAADEAKAKAAELQPCLEDARACATSAHTYEDASMCRSDFAACASQVVDLPELSAPNLDLPALPALPDTSGLLAAAGECRNTARDCVDAADGDTDATAQCASAYRSCMRDQLKAAVADASDGAVDLDAIEACGEEARACAKGADAEGVKACIETLAECVGADVPDTSAWNIPSSDELGNLAACHTAARSCVKAATTTEEMQACRSELATCVGVDSQASDCVSDLGTCLHDGGDPSDCAQQARTCAGL